MDAKSIAHARKKAAESTDYKMKQRVFKERYMSIVYDKHPPLNKSANAIKRGHKFIVELLMRRGKPKEREYFLKIGLSEKQADFLFHYQGQTRSMAERLERRFYRGDYELL